MKLGHRAAARAGRPHRLGLQGRVILVFGAGAALVSMTVAVVTYAVAYHYLLYRTGRWYSPSVSVGRNIIPASIMDEVRAGNPAEQRVVLDGAPVIVVG